MAAESEIERKLVREVQKAGGLALKFVSPGCAGVPDRLVLMPGGRASFAEVKAPGEKPRALQRAWMKKLKTMGFRVWIVDSVEGIAELIRERQGFPTEVSVREGLRADNLQVVPTDEGDAGNGLHQPEID